MSIKTLKDALSEVRSALSRKKATVALTLATGVNLISDGRGETPSAMPFAITVGGVTAQQAPWPEAPGFIISMALTRDQLLELRAQADDLLEAWQ